MGGAEWDNHPSSTRPTSQLPNHLPPKSDPPSSHWTKNNYFLYFSSRPPPEGLALARCSIAWFVVVADARERVSEGGVQVWVLDSTLRALQNVLRVAAG